MIVTAISDRGLVRLIPATYHKPPSLRGLVDSDMEMDILAEIEGMTSARLTAERGLNLHVDRRELAWKRRKHDLQVYGNSHINAAFTYTRAGGNRFNDESRGAWYCSWETMTSVAEVAYHKTRELRFIGVFDETARYVELVADFIGDYPDITGEEGHPALDPDPARGYPAGQALAEKLRREGHDGLIYPSVRQPGGRCLVVFEPAAIRNVRPGASWDIVWKGSADYSVSAV
ncbi:RES family NAD+ phosphorylase [Rhizobium sp. XQZ8]|uniref:RES family NAD+ phosphorylase n=1 Tax=Rhizobium populisoli TaxID=2859785 RepID=UPI001C680BEE|nr:RES family NAD+ phosphorylase [Rhizobium populisoli]MBW6420615.1 RES family NAD+ phosphorylase [Rhizobium populisoli]